MKKLFIVFVILGIMAMAGMATAATDQQDLSVTASVAAACRVTGTAAVAFGAYDPTAGTANNAGQGSMSIQCVKNTSYKTYISGTRNMTGAGGTLPFTLWRSADRSTTTFPATGADESVAAPSNAVIQQTVYGQIPAEQDVGVGDFIATLQATVEY